MNGLVDKETKPNICRGGQSLQMSQILRFPFADTSDNEGALNHFNHRHPLFQSHFRQRERIQCSFCNIVISGRGYACNKHCDYYLHEVCSNFPREIQHDFHPGSDHNLILRPFKATNREQFHCAACGHDDSVHSLFQSYYGCESCNFNLHVECASIPITLDQKVKYPLHLFLSFPITSETATLSCSICTEVVPTSGCWLFYNHKHDYLCHVNCAAVSEYGVENHSMDRLQNRLQTLATTNRPPTTLEGQPSGNVTHFSHRHTLKEYNSDKSLACNLCRSKYFKGYFCSDCNYFIDRTCFSVPSMIQHMSHPQHPLRLTCYLDYQNENVNCRCCQVNKESSHNRAYYCAPCKFILSCQCAGAPKTLTLASNVSYKLFFEFPFKHENAEVKCKICSEKVVIKDGLLYYNLERDETLHVSCALTNESKKKMTSLIPRLNEVRITE
ncbi:uncharacterized protein [Solanum tuberosum]|uniref:DC1 domain-containing protein n=1 Tax=Solanum tuberosum TaxID=4113 RepID=M1ATB5_SOLTU|nr:PREDICTED: uncharacterized protein LOC107057841 [Solanum tuberosum]